MFANKTPQVQNNLVDQALDGLAGTVHGLRQQAEPMVDRVADRASALARHGMDAVREGTHELGERAHRVANGTRSYVQEEPVKSLLIAAATGAALMALLSYLDRSRRND
jgi:ElaB/YqjD/DUF883 family membrane-anchored ribosome-binding protein